MTFRSSSALALASAALLAACGGRTQLRDSAAASAGSGGDGGSGPAPSSASASSGGGMGPGGAGGAGGATGLCQVDGPPIGLAGTEGYNLSNPVLIAPEKAGVATLVAGWTALEGPMTPPTELRHTSFDPWGSWPADGTIGPSYLADYDGGESFAAAPAIGGFSLLFRGAKPSTLLTFLSPLSPGSGMIPGSLQLGAIQPEPLFVAQGAKPDVHLIGFDGSESAPHYFNLCQVKDPSLTPVLTYSLGCAKDPIVAAAAAAPGGFLVAFSSGTDFNDPVCQSGGPMSAATHILLGRVDSAGTFTSVVAIKNDPSFGSIAAIKMVPSGDGIWVAWAHQLGNGAPLLMMRLNSTATTVKGPIEVPFSGDPASLSAARLGDRLALAWTEAASNATPLVRVSVVGTSGVVPDATITLGPAATGRTALLGSPSGDALLVSWVEEPSSTSSTPRLRAARISCSLP